MERLPEGRLRPASASDVNGGLLLVGAVETAGTQASTRSLVMPGLVPGIRVSDRSGSEDADILDDLRNEPGDGHDGERTASPHGTQRGCA